MIFSHHTIHLIAKSDNNIAQYAVVHVHTAFPYNLTRIDLQCISLLNMIVQHCCKQIIGRSDRMEISGKMQIQIFHRNNLRISSAGRTAFDPEARS